MEEFTDEQTGIRLTVERDGPYQEEPRITAFAPEGSAISHEELKEAIGRLLAIADVKPQDAFRDEELTP